MSVLPPRNLLAEATSPYLRQHAGNPVHWRPWSAASLKEAETLRRPILLSVGYAACHWCHVMAHESFEDEAVAEVMNRLFVNIKVDREERPDIDQIYMAALNAMGEQGGWPLTMFLTPDGRPFWGGTYFPRTTRYGRPGFIEVLEAVAATWRDRQGELDHSADALARHVALQLSPPGAAGFVDAAATLATYASGILSLIDNENGGIAGAPKFPNAPLMDILRLDWQRNGKTAARDAVLASLRAMLAGGIYDHLGGGLCRYSTDAHWLVPHFEKMLYDNAQLIDLAGWAYAETGEDLFRLRIEETIGWLVREMRVDGGGFASSLDADSEGEEGRFYLWSEAGLRSALGEDGAQAILRHYRLEHPTGWEGDPILARRGEPGHGPADHDPSIQELKERLLAYREHRPRPGRDDKVLVDWNGMAIAAIARAGRQFARADWVELAASAFHFVTESEIDGRLPHSILGESRLFPCLSSDYASMIAAAVALAEATGDVGVYAKKARNWMAALDRWHGDEDGKAHYFTASDAGDVPMRIRGDTDEAVPSATSRIVAAMTRLSMLTGDGELHQRAIVAADAALGRTTEQRFGRAGIIHAGAIAHEPSRLILVGTQDSAIVSAANRYPDAQRTDIRLPLSTDETATLPDGTAIDTSRAGAWLCLGLRCLPPVRTAAELDDQLRPGRR